MPDPWTRGCAKLCPGLFHLAPLGLGSRVVAKLASAIHGTLLERRGKHSSDRGIKPAHRPDFAKLAHPAVFLDAGSLGDPAESRLIDNDAYQKAVAGAICLGVLKYRNAV